jgi:predicted transcriptional regulator
MVDESGAIEHISFLTRSESRVRILTYLLANGPTTQRAFRDELSSSRSTVTRALSALEDRDWIERIDGGYQLTPQGHIVADSLDALVDVVQATDELATFIEWFPYTDYDISIDQLRDAEITASTEPDPYAPSRKHAAVLQEADRFRMLLPSIDLQMVRTTQERIAAGDMTIEFIVSPGMEETIVGDEFAAAIRSQMEAGGMTVLVAEEPAPFYLGLSDDGTVQLGVEDDEGFPRALVESDDDDLREWAVGVYDSARESAREKPIEDFEP